MLQCVGIFMKYQEKGEMLPSITEVARQVGCDKGTASRALKWLEGKRNEQASRDVEERYRKNG
jgi:DNA-binding transcriptional regulator YhcF (GntR family)